MAPPQRLPPELSPTQRWSVTLTARPRGFSLAREPHILLIWDDQYWLTLINGRGQIQGKVAGKGNLTGTAAADDGSAFAAVGGRGEVWWLAPDLSLRWEQALPTAAVSVALDAHGYHLAASDVRGNLHLFDRQGKSVTQIQTPRAVQHLAFIPEADRLIAAADFGLVTAFDLGGRCLWQDRLFAHLGSLAVDGAGDLVVLACFTDGLRSYDRSGKVLNVVPLPDPCRFVAMSYDGDYQMAGGLEPRLYLLGRNGPPRAVLSIPGSPVALVLGPLGRYAVVGIGDGRIIGLDLPER